MTITLTTGLQASGKSTFARQMVENGKGNTVAVSLDDVRNVLGFGSNGPLGWTKELEETAMSVQDDIIVRAVKQGKDVVVHNTHLTKRVPTRIKKLFDGDVEFHVADFTHVDVETCIKRDAARALTGGVSVGEKVIRDAARHLRKPWRLTEEFMNDVKLSPLYVPKFGTPTALLVDLDGTIARHDHRSPYDYSRLSTDGLIIPVARVVDLHHEAGHAIVYLSGRPDINNVRFDTSEWLRRNYMPEGRLIMRPADMLTDNDADVKQFLFDKYIRDNYTVVGVLDDRNRVVRRWRKLGLTVFQAADGDF